MKVCYFGIYDPEYARNRVLIKGLRLSGIEVILCYDRSPSLMKYIRLCIRHWRIRQKYDVMIVGFPGQIAMPLARLISSRPIILDAFISFYEMNVFDRSLYSSRSFYAAWYFLIDWLSCRMADIVLLDTNAHIDYFAKTFNVPRKKMKRVLGGAEIETEYAGFRENFLVHWHGSCIPLHGVEYILRAPSFIRDESVRWEFVGCGDAPPQPRVAFSGVVSFHELMERVKKSTICLGIFGATAKAQRVIPNKIYEYLSAGKPVITADTPAIREIFTEKELLLIPSCDSAAIAYGVSLLKNDTELRRSLAANGRKKFLERATPAVLGLALREIIKEVLLYE